VELTSWLMGAAWDTSRAVIDFTDGAITLFGCPSQNIWLPIKVSHRSPATPLNKFNGLDYTRFARRYSGYLVLDFFSWSY
jgi:hypothetical protein